MITQRTATRVFRGNWYVLYRCLVISLGGMAAVALTSNRGITVASLVHASKHQLYADSGLLLTGGLGCISVVVGIASLIVWRNATIQTSMDGVKARDYLGRICFQAPWASIDSVETRKTTKKTTTNFDVYAGDQRMTFSRRTSRYADLMNLFRHHSPQVNYTPWDSAMDIWS